MVEEQFSITDDIDDCDLMLACQEGSKEAFDIIVERYSTKLVNFFYRLCWSRDLAEDLAQDVLLKLYRNRHQYRKNGSFVSYIYCVARNLWIDKLRQVKITTNNYENMENLEICSSQMSPEQLLIYKEKWQSIQKTIQQLPEEQRMVFLLYEQDIKYKDIAQILEIPEGTVKSRLHIVFNKLRDIILTSVYMSILFFPWFWNKIL